MNDSAMIRITFPDGCARDYERGVTGRALAESISSRLGREALSVTVNGEVRDLARPIEEDAVVRVNTWEDADGKMTFWHSSAHLMAEAVEALFPGAQLAIGPAIEAGFYYDIDFGDRKITEEDLGRIEAKMKELAKRNETFTRRSVSKAEALATYRAKGDPYKVELIEGLEDGNITFYTQGCFTDLCRGPHLEDTSVIKAVKLLSVAGAYWRGDERNKQLTRLYGITFPKQSLLDEYLQMLEEAKKRDHRKIGKEMGLFTFSTKVGPGLPLWLPKGAMLRERLERFLREVQNQYGYLPVITPHIGQKELYVTSGHWAKYGADSFRPIQTPQEGEEFMLKPMNCPHHCEIYRSQPHSYRDLPVRLAEFGTVYRYEQSGELHGLTRVRGFTQDDAHIFCTPEQLKDEFLKVIDIVLYIFKVLDFRNYDVQISLRDSQHREKYIGTDENWDRAERAIREAVEERGMNGIEVEGEAAFYGPKLDFMVRDAIGRKWQLGTIQVDYNLPERFDLEYVGADDQRHRPVMIHRAPFGSMERFVAVLIEHTGGRFPLWLAPEQVSVLPVSDKYIAYAERAAAAMRQHGIRVVVDTRGEKVGKKIRDAELQRTPYIVVVGEREEAGGTLSVRERGGVDVGAMRVSAFVERVEEELARTFAQ